MLKWSFAPLGKGMVRRDPCEQVLFKSEQSESNEYAGTDQLVREILQNSLDAAASDDKPVHVCLALYPRNQMVDDDALAKYFRGLESPLSQKDDDVSFVHGVPEFKEGFLVCEDFNTNGLEGDTTLDTDPPKDDSRPQDFFWFWRNIGRSGKTGDDLGRWGLGKTVYRAAGRACCMFGLTIRRSDRCSFLMGQAVLAIHKMGEKEFVPEGFWGKIRQDGFPLPVDDAKELQQFRRDWRLERNDEPGLSVVVPFVDKELQGDKLAQAVAVNFLVPLLKNQLTVEIKSPNINVSFTQDSLKKECENLNWKGTRRNKRNAPPPVQFVAECLRFAQDLPESNLLGTDSVPKFSENSFCPDILEKLRNDYRQNKLTAAKIRISL